MWTMLTLLVGAGSAHESHRKVASGIPALQRWGGSIHLVCPGCYAARQIVRATQRGEAERILSLLANVLERLHGMCPGTTTNLLSAVNRVLPKSRPTSAPSALGLEVQQRLVRSNARLRSRLLEVLTGLGRAAAHRLHQYAPAAADARASTHERRLAPPVERRP